MKQFAIYSKVHFVEKPIWFEGIYTKYNTSSTCHITLKQTCFLEEAHIQDVKDRLMVFLNTFVAPDHKIILHFNELVVDATNNKQKTIMLAAEYNQMIQNLQKRIVSALAPYRDFLYSEAEEWERDFKPHITIASDVDEERCLSIIDTLGQGFECEGTIQDISLIIVDKMVPENADKLENQTIYIL